MLVQERGQLLGVLTDRDLALRVVGPGLDPTEIELREVMTPNVSCAAGRSNRPAGDRGHGGAPHQAHTHTRGEQVVGIVTLDDLILSGDADLDTLATVVRAQLAAPSHSKGANLLHPMRTPREASATDREERHQSRAGKALHDFSKQLRDDLGLEDPQRALTAFEVVATALVERLTAAEANDFVSQLPSLMRERLAGCAQAPTLR